MAVFDNCDSLEELNLPNVSNISTGYGETSVFGKCPSMKKVYAPKFVQSYSTKTLFNEMPILEDVTVGVTKEKALEMDYYGARSGCVFHCTDGDVTVP